MILANFRMRVEPAQRQEALSALRGLLGPTRAEPGCLDCCLYEDSEDEQALCFTEAWQGRDELVGHLRGSGAKVLLAVLDLASQPPEVRFSTVSDTAGMELIEKALGLR